MSPQLIKKRVELHALLKEQWQTIVQLHFPKLNRFEYRSGIGIIGVVEHFKPDGTLYQIKLTWLKGDRKNKLVTSAEIDNLLSKLKTVSDVDKNKKALHLPTDKRCCINCPYRGISK